MEFRQLKYFIEVAKREHMTEAADALHVAQSSVSRSIYNLEQELGVNLFIREGRNVRLTPIGRLFYERASQITHLMEESKREINEFLNPNKGTVRIAFPVSMAAHTLPSIIYAFRKKYPEAKFEMNNALFNDLIGGVKNGSYNIAITAPIPDDSKDSSIKSHVLFHENIVALLPLRHPLAKQKKINLLELKNDPFCVLPDNYMFHQLVLRSCKQVGFEPNIAFEGKDIDALKGLVSAGLGVALIPEMTLIDNTPRTTVAVKISHPNINRPVGVITPTQRSLLPTEQLFYDFLKEYCARLDQFRQ
ncbi:LysR family transcriptional regulator [Bacillaceae bacterium W0354]